VTLRTGRTYLLTLLAAGVLLGASGLAKSSGAGGAARLTAVSARVNNSGASLVIEASEPVPYVATRPDPLTVVLDLRNVDAEGVANSVVPNAKSPITRVAVEPVDSLGATTARVRISLTQPVAHHVRSDRNAIIIDFDKPSAKNAAGVLPPASRDAMAALTTAPPAVDPIDALGRSGPTTAKINGSNAVDPLKALAALQPPANAASLQQTPAGAQTPPTPQGAVTVEQTGRRFTGTPVSLDFQGADLRAVLRTFAEISGLNIVIDPTVQGTVDVALRDVPWDQALDLILRANKLEYVVDGTIVRIAPRTVLAAEEKERSDLAKAQADAGQLGTLTRQLSYSKGDELVNLLKQGNVLSSRGQAFVDARTNTLIVTDLQNRLISTNDLINTLDKPQAQVEIEARIVQTNRNYARALGVQWGFAGQATPALGNTTNLAFPNSVAVAGATAGNIGTGITQVPAAVNLAAPAASSAVGLALGSVNGSFNLDVALSALETSGNGRLLSTPRVTTQNNVPAEMTQGVQIPIQTVANNTVSVTFKDAALTLKVTPQITAAGTVIMQIQLENASPDFSRAINNIPPINTQRALTSVLVSDGQTTVIGGIYVSQQQASTDRTPGLGQIPLIKWLFKRDTLNDQSTELLVFITPRIVKS
jgi:type IV pilus assembly protein PilQ